VGKPFPGVGPFPYLICRAKSDAARAREWDMEGEESGFHTGRGAGETITTPSPVSKAGAEKTGTRRADDGVWRLAATLLNAVSPLDVARALAEEGAATAGASFSNMALLDVAAQRVRVVHDTVLDPVLAARWSEFDLTEATPLGEAIVTGLPVLFSSIEELTERYPQMVADTLAASLHATASLPLVSSDGVILGAAGFGWAEAQVFDVEQVRRLDLICRLVAQAIERAGSYRREHDETFSHHRVTAQLLQSAFLPRVLPETAALDVAALYLPASNAPMGGDWYDVFPVEGGTCLVIGDVAGHGPEAAALMVVLRNTVRAYAIEDPSPARVLTRLNNMMCRLEPGVFATAIVAVWDQHRGTLLRSNAGHPPVLRCREGEFGYLVPPPGGRLLGATPGWEYHEEIKVLRPGTTLLLYTDGLIERRRQVFDDGMNALLSFVAQLEDLSPQAVCDDVLQWRLRSARLDDDMCLLAVRSQLPSSVSA
jgi:serine phosphatase RsbU (regulator of sigma subunit)